MTRRFVENRIAELERVSASLLTESHDPDSKGLSLRVEVGIARGYIARAIDTLGRTLGDLTNDELERHAQQTAHPKTSAGRSQQTKPSKSKS